MSGSSAARDLLADDARYTAPGTPGEVGISCANADEIVRLMRAWKGQLPDVEVIEWELVGDRVVVRFRQPAFGDDADWYQVLSVRDGSIVGLQDFPTREGAGEALGDPP